MTLFSKRFSRQREIAGALGQKDARGGVPKATRSPHLRSRVALLLALAATGAACAQSAGVYDLSWSTLDNGGGRASAGVYELNASVAQSDAQPGANAGVYSVAPGYWPGVQSGNGPLPDAIFRSGFE